jgi:carboxypeptidase Taq
MSNNALVQQLLEEYKPIWALDHAFSLFEWDTETYMPVQASKARGFAQAQMALMKQERVTDLVGPTSKAEKLSDLSDYEKGILRTIKRDLDYYTKVPPKLLEELQRTTTEASMVWREARRKSDFQMFKDYLQKIVELKKQEAEKLGYEGHPYNALLDRYEEGLTVKDVDKVFSALVPSLKRILSKVLSDGKYPTSHPLESLSYEEDAMRRVNTEILTLLGMPEKTFRMDVSTHPFTSSMSLEDVRVTTRYEGKGFRESLFSLIHECGHALYDLQVDRALEYTPLAEGTSLGVHESQSRFWENFIGRSREFTKLVYPILKKNLQFVRGYSEDEVYRYFNLVRASPIRVEADELTYNFHIVLRYEMEKKIVGGDVSASEIPSLWDDMMEEYVGVRPRNYAEGVLQDIHWSGGFGYFPTYSLGNVIGGMVFHQIRKDMDLEDAVRHGKLKGIKGWLRDHLHKWGSTYSPKELQMKAFGEVYNPEHLVSYLEHKYLE